MKKKKIFPVAFIALVISTTNIKAEVNVSAGADFVSTYVWRGLYQTGTSFQPSISLSVGNFSVGTWGSATLNDVYEFDLYASYSLGNLGITITDYYFPTTGLNDYFSSGHLWEATAAYIISESIPLSLAWSTNLMGDDDFSSYFEVGYSLSAGDVGIDLAVGATPWSGAYSDGFALINASIKASKEFKITDSFSIPAFTQAILNPDTKDVFLVFGVSF